MNRSKRSNNKGSYAGPKAKQASRIPRAKINATDPKSVGESLFIPMEMNTILAAVGGEVTIKLGPGSQSVQITRNGAIIMTEQEVRELSQINRFVKNERKSDVSAAVTGHLEGLAYKLLAAKRAELDSWKPVLIGPNQLVALKDRDTQVANLAFNAELINGNKQAASTNAKEYLLSVIAKIRNVIAECALSVLDEGKTKDIYDVALARHVPRWAIVRLANTKLTGIDPSIDLTKTIFPSDFSKGISVTLEEIRSVAFVAANPYIFQRSGLLTKCLQSDKVVKILLGYADSVDLTDSTNAEVNRAMKSIVTLAPIDSDLKRLAKTLEGRGTSMKWAPKGKIGDSKSILLAFSHAMIKAFFGMVRTPERFNAWWKLLFPNDYNTLVTKDFSGINNSVGHWLGEDAHLKPTNWDCLFGSSHSTATREYFVEAVCIDLQEFSGGALCVAIKALIDGVTVITNGVDLAKKTTIEREMPSSLAIAMSRQLNDTDRSGFNGARKLYFAGPVAKTESGGKAQKRGRNADPTSVVRGRLDDDNTDILDQLKKDGYLSVKTLEASKKWLRGFTNPGVRQAAAVLLAARFDAYEDEDEVDVDLNTDFRINPPAPGEDTNDADDDDDANGGE